MENIGLVAPTPEELEIQQSLLGRIGSGLAVAGRGFARGMGNLSSNPRAMAGIGGLAQGLLQAGAVSNRPVNWSEAMAMGLQGFNQGRGQYDAQQSQQLQDQLARMKMASQMNGGAVFGDSMTARAWDVVLRAQKDPSLIGTPEYSAAVAIIETPRIMQGPEGAIDMTGRLPDVFSRPGTQQVPAADGQPATGGQPMPPQGQAPSQPRQPGVIPGTEKLSADQKEYDKAFESLSGLKREFGDYGSALDEYGVQYGIGGKGVSSRGDYSSDAEQTLISRHTSIQLALKSPELFALGVLAGEDKAILDSFLPSPTQIRTLIRDGGIEAAEARIRTGYNEAARHINNKIDAYNSRWEGAPIKAKPLPRLEPLPPRPSGGGKISTPDQAKSAGWTLMTDANGNQAYVGPNNQIIEVK